MITKRDGGTIAGVVFVLIVVFGVGGTFAVSAHYGAFDVLSNAVAMPADDEQNSRPVNP